LTAAVEFKRPSAGLNLGFKLELTGQAWADGTDAFSRFMTLTVRINQGCLKATNGNG
jgi:hypothetical protein